MAIEVPVVYFKPEAGDVVVARIDDHARIGATGAFALLRDEGDTLVVHAEVDGHHYVDRVAKSLVRPDRGFGQYREELVARLLEAFDARERKIAEAVRAVPHVPGYYWAMTRFDDSPVIVELSDESNVGNGLVAYVAGDESYRDLDCFYNYELIRHCPVWLERGKRYGQT